MLFFSSSFKRGAEAPTLPVTGLLKKCHTTPLNLLFESNTASFFICNKTDLVSVAYQGDGEFDTF